MWRLGTLFVCLFVCVCVCALDDGFAKEYEMIFFLRCSISSQCTFSDYKKILISFILFYLCWDKIFINENRNGNRNRPRDTGLLFNWITNNWLCNLILPVPWYLSSTQKAPINYNSQLIFSLLPMLKQCDFYLARAT